MRCCDMCKCNGGQLGKDLHGKALVGVTILFGQRVKALELDKGTRAQTVEGVQECCQCDEVVDVTDIQNVFVLSKSQCLDGGGTEIE